jgi:Mn-dependent DtxR family transcriptional regulator
MNLDAKTLRALFRMTSRHKTIHLHQIAARTGANRAAARGSIERLRALGLAETRPAGAVRLTMPGLALAAALAAARPRRRSASWGMSRAA